MLDIVTMHKAESHAHREHTPDRPAPPDPSVHQAQSVLRFLTPGTVLRTLWSPGTHQRPTALLPKPTRHDHDHEHKLSVSVSDKRERLSG